MFQYSTFINGMASKACNSHRENFVSILPLKPEQSNQPLYLLQACQLDVILWCPARIMLIGVSEPKKHS